mmetsp:Transcript_73466/g.116369  ORF Transcript_73466/g.116369 Transcript_73466/m.116369 type:complete len:106 (-) Transcript_73466:632-949(-)
MKHTARGIAHHVYSKKHLGTELKKMESRPPAKGQRKKATDNIHSLGYPPMIFKCQRLSSRMARTVFAAKRFSGQISNKPDRKARAKRGSSERQRSTTRSKRASFD